MSKLGYPHNHQQQTSFIDSSLPADDDYSPVDTGLIQCICDSTDDDGFTIQCDRCLTWQHAYCMNINHKNIPDRHLCDVCVNRIPSATTIISRFSIGNDSTDRQQQRVAPRKYNKSHQFSTEVELASGNGSLLWNSNSKPSTATTPKQKEDKTIKVSSSSSSFNSKRSLSGKWNRTSKRSRRMSTTLDGEDSTTSNSDGGIGNDNSTPKKSKLTKRRLIQRYLMSNESTHDVPPKRTTVAETGSTMAVTTGTRNKTAQYQPTSFNTVKSRFVYQVMKETTDRWKQSTQWTARHPWRRTTSYIAYNKPSQPEPPQQQQQQRPRCPFTVMDDISLQQSSSTHIAIRPLPPHQHHHHHHSLLHRPSSPIKLRKGAFADTPLHANTFLLEAYGEMRLKSEYKFEPGNDYSLLGTPCAHVLFYPTVDLCIDGRRLGNDARYLRRSCHPNAELRTMMVFPRRRHSRRSATTGVPVNLQNDDDGDDTDSDIDEHEGGTQQEGVLLRLGVFTRTFIEQGEEITLGWNWQKGHISWRKNVEWCRSFRQDQTNRTLAHVEQPDDATKVVGTIQQMLKRFTTEFGDCACRPNDGCLLERLEQESSSSSMTNGGLAYLEPIPTVAQSRQNRVATTENGCVAPVYSSSTPGSMQNDENGENVDSDVIPMASSSTTPSPTTSLDPPIKNEFHSAADDSDVENDIDIGVDLPVATLLPSENGGGSNFGQQVSSSSSPMSRYSAAHSDDEPKKNGMDDDSTDSRPIMKKKRNYGSFTDETRAAFDTPRSTLPCKKTWVDNFLQHEVKTEDSTGTISITDTTKRGNGGLSDASSESTIPVDDDDLGDVTSRHTGPTTTEVSATLASIHNTNRNGTTAFDTITTTTNATNATSINTVISPPQPLSLEDDQSLEQQHTATITNNDPAKPTKIKVTLQEYISRKMVNQDSTLSIDTTTSSASPGMAKPIP